MKIFISYRRADSGRDIGRIRDRLKKEFGEQSVFRDLVDIPAGVDYRAVLHHETNDCDVMLVVIGPLWASVTDAKGKRRLLNPADPTRIEVETGLRRAEEDKAMVVPVLVMGARMPAKAELPKSLRTLRNQNAISIQDDPYFDFDMERLIADIRRAHGDAWTVEYFEPETVLIAGGSFWMGSEEGEGIPSYETPRHEVSLPSFRIGKYPVTNSQYEYFVHETDRPAPQDKGWDVRTVGEGLGNYPVTGVTWHEALAYCEWLRGKTGRQYMLPDEAQWEKACRGGGQGRYPWGDEFDTSRSNHGNSRLAPVDAYPAQNDCGLFDLVGNVRQWTSTLWGEKLVAPDPRYCYPWSTDPADRRNDLSAGNKIRRVIRGVSFAEDAKELRSGNRAGQRPDDVGWTGAGLGFRVAVNVP